MYKSSLVKPARRPEQLLIRIRSFFLSRRGDPHIDRLAILFLISGSGSILLYFLAQEIAVLGFSMGNPISPSYGILAILLSAGCVMAAAYRDELFPDHRLIQWIGVGVGVWVLVVLACFAVSALVYDFSWDGRAYHTQAVTALADGWNPLFTEPGAAGGEFSIWLIHYPKGPWITAAEAYLLTGSLNASKGFGLVLAYGVFSLALYALLSFTPLHFWKAVGLAFLAAANPVTTNQVFSLYNDTYVASILAIAVLAMWLVYQKSGWLAGLALFSTVASGANTKFNAAGFLILLLGWMGLGLLLRDRKANRLAGPAAIIGAGLAFGIFALGANPYINNFVTYGNPFYPVAGVQPGDPQTPASLLHDQIPASFQAMGRAAQVFHSMFAPSHNPLVEPVLPIKLPFSLTKEEVQVFSGTDIRLAGFGPWFSGALLLSMVGLWLLHRSPWGFTAAWMAAGIILSTVVTDGGWWARYVPQVWWIPVLVLCGLALMVNKDERVGSQDALHSQPTDAQRRTWRNPPQLIMAVLGIVLAVNFILTAGTYAAYNLSQSLQVHALIQDLDEQGEPVAFYDGPFGTTKLLLEEAGIPALEVRSEDGLPCTPQRLMLLVSYSLLLSCPHP